MAKPNDTQCIAKVDGDRCENAISYNEDGDYWSVLCKEHSQADEAGRISGKPRVARMTDPESEPEVVAEEA